MLQVFDNLIDNALEYSPPSEPLRIRGNGSHDGVVVEITDHGIGIPHAERRKVFEKFYRVDGTNISGSGLGLSIAIEIVSAGPRGTTLRLTLPIANTRRPTAELPRPDSSGRIGRNSDSPVCAPKQLETIRCVQTRLFLATCSASATGTCPHLIVALADLMNT